MVTVVSCETNFKAVEKMIQKQENPNSRAILANNVIIVIKGNLKEMDAKQGEIGEEFGAAISALFPS